MIPPAFSDDPMAETLSVFQTTRTRKCGFFSLSCCLCHFDCLCFFPLVALLAHGIMFVRRLDVSLMVVWVVNLIFIPFILQYEDAFLNFGKKIHIRNFLPDGFSLTAHFANNETTKYADKMCKVLFC